MAKMIGVALLGCAVSLVLTATSIRATGDDLVQLEQQAMQTALARVADSVVRIQSVGGRSRVDGVAVGDGPCSGLVVSPDGLILSSRFNFARRPTTILVELPSGARLPAKLLGRDESRGLVLLKVELPDNAPPLSVPVAAPTGSAAPGAWALAVGRALDARQANLSVGVISAVDRIWGKAIQTDAKVSPNNYGGPLVDIRGRVLGLLVPLSPNQDGEVAGAEWYDSGIGFAIPYDYIQQLLPRLKAGEILRPGFIGLSLRADDNLFGISPQVQAVHPDSPAAGSDLRVGDRIVAVNDQPVANIAELKYQIKPRFSGDIVRLTLSRDQQQLSKQVRLAAQSDIDWIKQPGGTKQKSPAERLPQPRKPQPQKKRDLLDRL
jgi:serine protease Do